MLGRIIAIGLIAAMVGSVVALAAVVLLPGNRLATRQEATDAVIAQADSATGAAKFSGRTSAWTVNGQLLGRGAGKFELELRVADAAGSPANERTSVDVMLSMQGHPMPPILATVSRLEPGLYRAVGEVSMYGRWRVRIALPDGVIHVLLDIGS